MLFKIYGGGKTPKILDEEKRTKVKGFYENLMKKNPKTGEPLKPKPSQQLAPEHESTSVPEEAAEPKKETMQSSTTE